MHNIKKATITILSACLTMSLCSCGSYNLTNQTNNSATVIDKADNDKLLIVEPTTDASSDTINNLREDETTITNLNRVTYQPNFYYESLSNDIKTRITGLSYSLDCTVPYEELRYVSVLYNDFNDKSEVGELICNKAIAEDLVEIFYELYQADYPIEQIRLIDEYNADDDLSCLDNNTSCFNYRVVSGTTKLSKHARGLAIDINPFYNPYITYPNGVAHIATPGSEAYADRTKDFAYKIDENDLCYQLFTEHGFTWGGAWSSVKDYQHFQKDID